MSAYGPKTRPYCSEIDARRVLYTARVVHITWMEISFSVCSGSSCFGPFVFAAFPAFFPALLPVTAFFAGALLVVAEVFETVFGLGAVEFFGAAEVFLVPVPFVTGGIFVGASF